MSGIIEILTTAYQSVLALPLNTALYIAWGAYAAVFAAAFIFTLLSEGMRRADKKPFLSFTNAFAAVTLALMLTQREVAFSILCAVVFWCIGYLLYGLLVLVSRRRGKRVQPSAAIAAASAVPPADMFKPNAPPARGNVRLDHAFSVTEKLLAKELGRGDRQEVERIKTVLSLLRIKPELSPEENERLNENFNLLLKLMAKYNV